MEIGQHPGPLVGLDLEQAPDPDTVRIDGQFGDDPVTCRLLRSLARHDGGVVKFEQPVGRTQPGVARDLPVLE